MKKADLQVNRSNTKLIVHLKHEVLEAEKRHLESFQLRDMNGNIYYSPMQHIENAIFPDKLVKDLYPGISEKELVQLQAEASATWVQYKEFFEPLRIAPVPDKLYRVSEALVHWVMLSITFKSFFVVADYIGRHISVHHTVESVSVALKSYNFEIEEVKAVMETMVSLGGLKIKNGFYMAGFIDYTMKDRSDVDVEVEINARRYLKDALTAVSMHEVLDNKYTLADENEYKVIRSSSLLNAFYPFQTLFYVFP